MQLNRCSHCGTILREIEARNAFTKHAGCATCGTVYVMWGSTITRCETPTKCVLTPWRSWVNTPGTVLPVISGPHGMGMA
jgi:hypothetical protein